MVSVALIFVNPLPSAGADRSNPRQLSTLLLWRKIYLIGAASQFVLMAGPDKNTRDVGRQFNLAATVLIGKLEIQRYEPVRMRNAAHNLRQLAWFQGSADGAESRRCGPHAGDTGFQIKQRVAAPGVTIGTGVAGHFHGCLQTLLDEFLSEVHSIHDQVAAAEFLPGFC